MRCAARFLERFFVQITFIVGESTEELDALFSGLERMPDSITSPKSLTSVSLTAGNRLLNVLLSRDNLRFTPQLSHTDGTQEYGFNQAISTYLVKRSGASTNQFTPVM